MNLKCRSGLFFVILMLFLYDIRMSFADDVVNLQKNDESSKQKLLNSTLDDTISLEDKKSEFSAKQISTNNLNNKIITFQINRALNVDFNDIKVDDGIGFLHSDDEYQALYNMFVNQNIKLNTRQKMQDMQDDEDDYIKEMNLKLSSLYYYNDNNWGCKINNRFIKKSNQNEAHSNVSIVKVNKDNILFILNRTKADDIEKIRKLKKSNYKYRSDYYIVKNGKTQSVMFRLYIGQSINLKSFRIQQ